MNFFRKKNVDSVINLLIFEPKKSHKAAVKCIGCYLKGTMEKGLILDPSDDLAIQMPTSLDSGDTSILRIHTVFAAAPDMSSH